MVSRSTVAAFAVLLAAACSGSSAFAADIQDGTKTPGAVREELTQDKICTIKWGLDERHVTDAMKRQVFADYGYTGYDDPKCIADTHGKTCEIDHLISRELGGADDVKNLWPESYGGSPWNAHLKDKLENRLHAEMCKKHTITLQEARDMIVNDWRVVYKKYYGEP